MASAYDILTPSRKQIRLIQLSPSTSRGDVLSCTSHTISLLDNPQYVALSYCWGWPTDKTKIEFNGIPDLSIPRNLDSALRQLRQESGARALWADSICINQDHKTPEKNQQVAMMGEIYAQASSTIIWLGEAADNSDLAMETISSLYEQNVWIINDDTFSAAHFEAIAALNARLWWSRVWVIQELLLSPNPKIMCGTKSAPIEAFIHLDDLRRGYHRPTGRTIDNALQPSRFLFKQHPFSQILHHYFNDKRRIEAGVVNLEEWVVVVNDFQATDPRDKIYGLLGLGTREDRAALPPDYSSTNTVAEVYCRATAHFILQRRDLLHLQFNANDIDPTLKLPSWCPDYSREADKVKERYAAFVVGAHADEKLAASGMDSEVSKPTEALMDNLFPRNSEGNWRELHLRGWEADEIVYAGINPYMPPYVGHDANERLANNARRAEQTKANILTWETEARRHLAKSNPYYPKTADDVFWRALIANRNFTWDPVPDWWKMYFNVWLDRAPLPASADDLATDEKEMKRLYIKPYTDAAITRPHGRAFIITRKGYLGLAPRKTKEGDVVSVLKGGSVPFILRRRQSEMQRLNGEQEEQWGFLGESFVMGLMDGEGVGLGSDKVFALL